MPSNLYILGPQGPQENLVELIEDLIATNVLSQSKDPIAVVSTGWRHDESNIDALVKALPLQSIDGMDATTRLIRECVIEGDCFFHICCFELYHGAY